MKAPDSRLPWRMPLAGSAAVLGLAALIGRWLGDPALAIGAAALGLLAWNDRQRQQIVQ